MSCKQWKKELILVTVSMQYTVNVYPNFLCEPDFLYCGTGINAPNSYRRHIIERVYGVVSECSGMPILQLEGKLVTFMFP